MMDKTDSVGLFSINNKIIVTIIIANGQLLIIQILNSYDTCNKFIWLAVFSFLAVKGACLDKIVWYVWVTHDICNNLGQTKICICCITNHNQAMADFYLDRY